MCAKKNGPSVLGWMPHGFLQRILKFNNSKITEWFSQSVSHSKVEEAIQTVALRYPMVFHPIFAALVSYVSFKYYKGEAVEKLKIMPHTNRQICFSAFIRDIQIGKGEASFSSHLFQHFLQKWMSILKILEHTMPFLRDARMPLRNMSAAGLGPFPSHCDQCKDALVHPCKPLGGLFSSQSIPKYSINNAKHFLKRTLKYSQTSI